MVPMAARLTVDQYTDVYCMLSLSIALDRLIWTGLDLEELPRLVVSSYRWIKRGIVGQAYKRHLWETWGLWVYEQYLCLKQSEPNTSIPTTLLSLCWNSTSSSPDIGLLVLNRDTVTWNIKNPGFLKFPCSLSSLSHIRGKQSCRIEKLQGSLARAWDQGCHPASCRCLMCWLSLLRSPQEVWENHLDLASFHGMLWLVPSLKASPASLFPSVECRSIARTSVASLHPFRKQVHWKSLALNGENNRKWIHEWEMNKTLIFKHVPTGARSQVNLETKSTYQVEQTCGSINILLPQLETDIVTNKNKCT